MRGAYLLYVIFVLLLEQYVTCDEVQGCGGYVKSDVDINFAQVGIKLYTIQGSLKYETECAPNDGYYFLPIYDKGQYVIKVAPPSGWSVEPEEVSVSYDGETDPCSQMQDINFHFKGFAVLGQVTSAVAPNDGPAGVSVSLYKEGTLVLSTYTFLNGHFTFTPLAAGNYQVIVSHPRWSFISDSSQVSVADQNGEVSSGSLVVRGYTVEGEVKGENGISPDGVTILLHSPENAAYLKHYSKYPPGCTAGSPPEFKSTEATILCYVTTEMNGIYKFTNLVPGSYEITAFKHTAKTELILSPAVLSFTVLHDDAEVKENFHLEGFNVRGQVLKRPQYQEGIANASVQLKDAPYSAFTDEQGSFILHSVLPGKYSLVVEADGYQFAPNVVEVSVERPVLPPVTPSHYTVCFKVVLERPQPQQSWSIEIISKRTQKKLNIRVSEGNGECVLLPLGPHTASVLLTQAQRQDGVRFGPLEHSFAVTGTALPDLIFSQFLGDVTVKVSCLYTCPPSLPVFLTAASGSVSLTANATPSAKDTLKATALFKEIVPGQYEAEVHNENWCFAHASLPLEVNTQNVEVELKQSGYLLTVTSSHSATLRYSDPRSKSEAELAIEKGVVKVCMPSPGEYLFVPVSCHQFTSPSYKWQTSDPSVLSLVALRHTVTASLTFSQSGQFLLQVQHSDGSLEMITPTLKTKNEYEFAIIAEEGEEITLTPTSSDDLFQFQPTSYKFTIPNTCESNVVSFKAETARFISGRVIPPVQGVHVTVQSAERKLEFVTDADGTYKAGPLDNSLEYNVTASLTGYTVTPLDDQGNFEAFKLAEVIVRIVDEESNPLPGVVVSISGGKSYRQNSLTGEDGSITFHSLLPGEYFMRSAMKEYSFRPLTKMIQVEEGATVAIDVSGVRVAYSAVGTTMSLTGVLEPDVAVEARGVGQDCQQYQEDAVSDGMGNFRIKGLLPKCEYEIGLKSGENVNQHIERILPAVTKIRVTGEDVTGLSLIVLRYFNQMDVVGTVETSKEFLSTITIKVYRDDVADSPVHIVKLINHPFFMLPPMMADGKTYTLHLESTLCTQQYSYRTPEVTFVSDSSLKSVKLNFRPTLRNFDADMNQNTLAALILALVIFGGLAYYDKIAPGIDWCLDRIGTYITNRPGIAGQLDAAKRLKNRVRRNS